MALTRFSGTDEIIRPLDNQPNDNNGLSADDLKAKFDQFGSTFKDYFNNTFIPEVESAINAAAAGIGSAGFSGALINDGTIMAEKLSSTEDIQAVGTQVIRDGAVTLSKLASALQALLGTVPNKAVFSTTQIQLDNTGWVNNEQTKTVQGVTASNIVIATAYPNDTSFNAWSNSGIRAYSQAENSITFRCRTTPSSNCAVNILILDTEG